MARGHPPPDLERALGLAVADGEQDLVPRGQGELGKALSMKLAGHPVNRPDSDAMRLVLLRHILMDVAIEFFIIYSLIKIIQERDPVGLVAIILRQDPIQHGLHHVSLVGQEEPDGRDLLDPTDDDLARGRVPEIFLGKRGKPRIIAGLRPRFERLPGDGIARPTGRIAPTDAPIRGGVSTIGTHWAGVSNRVL